MQGIKRRIVYLGLFESLAILLSATGLFFIMGVSPAHAGTLSVVASAVAIVWNLLYNMAFEAGEARFGVKGRSILTRVVHALGFELGLVAVLVPVIAWMLGITLIEAFLLDLGLIVFFLFYTFLFNLAFDRIFGLPASARPVSDASEMRGTLAAHAG